MDIRNEHEIWGIKCKITYFRATHLAKTSHFRHVNKCLEKVSLVRNVLKYGCRAPVSTGAVAPVLFKEFPKFLLVKKLI